MTRSLVALAVATTAMMVIVPCITWFGFGLAGNFPGRLERVDHVPALLVALSANVFGPFVGGFLVARMAGRREILHAIVFGIVMLAGAALDTRSRWEYAPVWFHVAFLSVLVPSGLLGGLVAKVTRPAEPAKSR